MSLNLAIKERALEVGFDLAGIAPLGVWKDLEFSRQWVEKGYGGEMRYLRNPKRHDPRSILPSAKSVICVGLVYNTPYPYSTEVDGTEARGQKPEARKGSELRTPNSEIRIANGQSPAAHRLRAAGRTTNNERAVPRAWISRYAWGHDYHEVMRAKLEELRAAIEELSHGIETRAFVDTGPIVERAFARFSGIGWMGKNTCLINEQKGSWFFLGMLLTSLDLEPDLPAPDRCGTCTRCLEACPTGALVEPYVMDASRCISYFTIELQGSIPEAFRAPIGSNIFGCDICQDVCPWNSKGRRQESEDRSQNENRPWSVVSRQWLAGGDPSTLRQQARHAATTTLHEFQPLRIAKERRSSGPLQRPEGNGQLTKDKGQGTAADARRTDEPVSSFQFPVSLFNPPLEALAALREEDFRRLFAHSPIKRVKYRGWLRNLCVAMGNSGDARFIPKLRELSQHPDPIVREHAMWALGELKGNARISG